MKYHTYSFENLEVWQLARKVRLEIYLLTRTFPKEEQFNLTSQIRRAIGSVTANLVEGSGRATDKDRAHFTNTAYCSALEVWDHIIAAYDLKLVKEEEYSSLRVKMDELINKLNAYYKYQVDRNSDLKKKLG
jgi:four helix bundle protein